MNDLLLPYTTLTIALVAVFIAFLNFRYQITILINTLLSNKATKCNFHLEEAHRLDENILKDTRIISNLLREIVTSKKLLDFYYKKHKLATLFIKKTYFVDPFYLQLNSTINKIYNNNYAKVSENLNRIYQDDILNNDYKISYEFLKKSIENCS